MRNLAEPGAHRCNRASDFRSRAGLPSSGLICDPLTQSRVVGSASSDESGRIDAALLDQHLRRRRPALGTQQIAVQQFGQGENPEAIDRWSGRRELIWVPSAARYQGLVAEADLGIDLNSQPQVVVFGGAQVFVESADRIE